MVSMRKGVLKMGNKKKNYLAINIFNALLITSIIIILSFVLHG